MRLKNILIVVKDIEASKKYYHDLFGLNAILDNDGNIYNLQVYNVPATHSYFVYSLPQTSESTSDNNRTCSDRCGYSRTDFSDISYPRFL